MSSARADSHTVSRAAATDVNAILEVLRANRHDTSLFQQSPRAVQAHIHEFLVVRSAGGSVIGCAQVREYRPGFVEILGVSVIPQAKGRGAGTILMERALDVARERNPEVLWLSTEKPGYFRRFGFAPFSKWSLPAAILAAKLASVFRQSPGRWLPAVLGRPVFMRPRGDR
jgi:amino-acid N-acetyltransferase